MNIYSDAYLQHSAGPSGPFCTEQVPFRRRGHARARRRAGPIRSYWQVHTAGRWRWVMVPSTGGPYVVVDRERVPVQFVLAGEYA